VTNLISSAFHDTKFLHEPAMLVACHCTFSITSYLSVSKCQLYFAQNTPVHRTAKTKHRRRNLGQVLHRYWGM